MEKFRSAKATAKARARPLFLNPRTVRAVEARLKTH